MFNNKYHKPRRQQAHNNNVLGHQINLDMNTTKPAKNVRKLQ